MAVDAFLLRLHVEVPARVKAFILQARRPWHAAPAAGAALGDLEPDERRELATLLDDATPEERRLLAELEATALLLATGASPAEPPPERTAR